MCSARFFSTTEQGCSSGTLCIFGRLSLSASSFRKTPPSFGIGNLPVLEKSSAENAISLLCKHSPRSFAVYQHEYNRAAAVDPLGCVFPRAIEPARPSCERIRRPPFLSFECTPPERKQTSLQQSHSLNFGPREEGLPINNSAPNLKSALGQSQPQEEGGVNFLETQGTDFVG